MTFEVEELPRRDLSALFSCSNDMLLVGKCVSQLFDLKNDFVDHFSQTTPTSLY